MICNTFCNYFLHSSSSANCVIRKDETNTHCSPFLVFSLMFKALKCAFEIITKISIFDEFMLCFIYKVSSSLQLSAICNSRNISCYFPSGHRWHLPCIVKSTIVVFRIPRKQFSRLLFRSL